MCLFLEKIKHDKEELMADDLIQYVRKLSGEEALKRYILIVKDSLKLFPKPGHPFTLKVKDKRLDVEVKLLDVWNQGRVKPNAEYHIDLSKHPEVFLPHFGDKVTLSKIKDNLYELT